MRQNLVEEYRMNFYGYYSLVIVYISLFWDKEYQMQQPKPRREENKGKLRRESSQKTGIYMDIFLYRIGNLPDDQTERTLLPYILSATEYEPNPATWYSRSERQRCWWLIAFYSNREPFVSRWCWFCSGVYFLGDRGRGRDRLTRPLSNVVGEWLGINTSTSSDNKEE